MGVTYLYVAMVVGLCISLLCEELFGISAGGMIVPGYMAIVCDSITQILLIFAVAFLVYFIVNFILPKFIILFGKRKFVATLIVGLIIKLVLELLFPVVMPFSAAAFRGVGVITPSLIANTCAKQGIRFTVPATLLAAYLTFGVVTVLFWIL